MISAGKNIKSDSPSAVYDSQVEVLKNRIQEGESIANIVADELKGQPFEVRQEVSVVQRVAQMIDKILPQGQLKLPGREQVVVDRRDQALGAPQEAAKEAVKAAVKEAAKENAKEAAKTSAKESAKEAIKDKNTRDTEKHARLDEKLAKQKGRFFTEKTLGRGGLEQSSASERVHELLSAFEKMVIARFEDGKTLEHLSPDGKLKLLAKTDAQWRDFFNAFLDRTVSKKVLFSEIREFLLRGLVGKGDKGIFIGDMHLNNGRIEKFVRFSILAEALAKLQNLAPGDTVNKGMLGELSGEELMFLALAVSRGREFATSEQAVQGKFMGGRAEAQAAEMLGLPLEAQLRYKAKSLKKGHSGSFGKGLFGGDGEPDELPYQFVPWWHWGNLSRPSKFKWVTAVFYGSLLAMALTGIIALTWRLLVG